MGSKVGILLFFAGVSLAGAASVEIDYILSSGAAAIDPITIPNPQGGEDLTVEPSLTIESSGFVATFDSDADGIISDGEAAIRDFTFAGSLDIEVSTTVTVIFPITVTANLTGPISGTQVSGSSGTLVGLTTYLETDIGGYDVIAGPLDCSDTALGLVCGLIETGLGIEFPLTQIAGEDAPLPFTGGIFEGLNSSRSTAGATINFSIPIDPDTTLGTDIDFTWLEMERRLVIPEPTSGLLAMIGGLLALRRRR